MLNIKTFKEGFTGLCEFYEKEPSEVYAKMYYEALKGLSDEQFKAACVHIVSTHKFSKMPLPADFLSYVYGDKEDAAMLALSEVEKAMREVGAFQSVVFDDPVTMIVISRWEGGWPGMCSTQDDEWKFRRQDFMKMWKAVAGMQIKPPVPQHLIGIVEGENSVKGYEFPDPVYIGNPEKCLAIHKGEGRGALAGGDKESEG